MKYAEFKSILDKMKSTFVPGVTFDNKNLGGSTIYTVTENDRLAMQGTGTIVLGVNGGTDKLIVVYKDGKTAEIK
jgi:hypothetical protein